MPPVHIIPLRKHGFHHRVWSSITGIEHMLGGVYVYAILAPTAIKIGRTSSHPHERLRTLQTGCPDTLKLLAYTTHTTERQMHRKLRRFHIRGEWYRICPEVLDELRTWNWLDEALLAQLETTRNPDSSDSPCHTERKEEVTYHDQ